MASNPKELLRSETVEPHQGTSGVLVKGQSLRIIDVSGQQVTDFVAVKQGDPIEYQDMVYSNLENGRYQWKVGDIILCSR